MLKNLTILAVFLSLTASAVLAVTGQTIQIQPVATLTWDQIVELDQKLSKTAAAEQRTIPFMPAPGPREISAKTPVLNQSQTLGEQQRFASAQPDATLGPALITNFAALGDNNTSIPPDTHGAAGPNHLMTMLNTQVRRQSLSGATQSTTSLSSFWFPAGASGPFDPRIIYDAGSGRWLATCDDGAFTAGSGVMFAISSTSDPSGAWTFYNIDADPTNVNWADYPDIGVNNTWIAITNNMFTVAGNAFSGTAMWVIDKSTALAGGPLTLTYFPAGFDVVAFGVNGFTLRPCLTFGPEPSLYIVDNSGWFDTGSGVYLVRLSRITGTGPAPSWSVVGPDIYGGTTGFKTVQNFLDESSPFVLGNIPAGSDKSYRVKVKFPSPSGNEYQLALVIFDIIWSAQIPIEQLPPECAHLCPTSVIEGTEDSERLTGTNESDLIIGHGGNDRIKGLSGDDCIIGGEGNDHLEGGPGDDSILGGSGNDKIQGASGKDLIYGGSGNDNIDGGSNDDVIYGEGGNDDLRGYTGEDLIYGGGGNDTIRGEAGRDKLYGEADNDTITGGNSDDFLDGGSESDYLNGNSGSDECINGETIHFCEL